MPEGLLTADGTVTAGVHDDPDHEPPASAEAPKGWAWKRADRAWVPRQRGPVKWDGSGSAGVSGGSSAAATAVLDSDTASGPGHPDPEPSWLRDDGHADDIVNEKLKWSQIPAEAKDNAASLAGMLGMPLLAFAQAADPYCGSVLAANYENIIDHTLPLILRSQKAIRFLTSDDSDWLLWFGLAQALWPLATAVYKHHIARTVEVVRDQNGRPFVRARTGDESGEHLQPPVPDFDYAA